MTLIKPKPLHLIGERTMLDHALDKLVEVGIERVVVNTHYLAEQIETHLQSRHDIEIIISREDELLETGGAIAKTLSYYDNKPFFALNADLPWIDGSQPSLQRMQTFWDPERMDVLLLLMQTKKAKGFDPTKGDYVLEKEGRIWRKNSAPPRPYVYVSAQILKPELFLHPPAKVFSNSQLWDSAEIKNRLYGIEHDGSCYHVGTPEDWQIANSLLTSGKGWGG
jgi:MurNAc alpha-1-phosphate uridylyltransferase